MKAPNGFSKLFWFFRELLAVVLLTLWVHLRFSGLTRGINTIMSWMAKNHLAKWEALLAGSEGIKIFI